MISTLKLKAEEGTVALLKDQNSSVEMESEVEMSTNFVNDEFQDSYSFVLPTLQVKEEDLLSVIGLDSGSNGNTDEDESVSLYNQFQVFTFKMNPCDGEPHKEDKEEESEHMDEQPAKVPEEYDKNAVSIDELQAKLKVRVLEKGRGMLCGICGKHVANRHNLRMHALTHKLGKDSRRMSYCPSCGKGFVKPCDLRRHTVIYAGIAEGLKVCSRCGAAFKEESQLERHMQEHSPVMPATDEFPCSKCKKTFMCEFAWQRHDILHRAPSQFPFRCNKCDATFPSARNLKSHASAHSSKWKRSSNGGERRFSCAACQKSFTRSSDMRRHQITNCAGVVSQTETPTTISILIQPSPSTSETIKSTVSTIKATGIKSKLPIITVPITSSPSLTLQTTPTPAPLTLTPASLTLTPPSLKPRYPNDKRCASTQTDGSFTPTPYTHKCDICLKSFRDEFFLESHKEMMHRNGAAEDRPYACYICQKRFKKQWHLKNHAITHSSSRPHVCTVCYKLFRNVSSYKRHISLHDASNAVTCANCGKMFNNASYLKKHTRAMHLVKN